MVYIIFIISLVSTFLFIYLGIEYFLGKKEYIYRLKKYINLQPIESRKRNSKNDIKSGLSFFGNLIGNLSVFDKYKTKIQKELIKAHVLLKGEEFITISIICTIIFVLLFWLIFHNIFVGFVFGILGWMSPRFIIKKIISKRIRMLNSQLADAIVLISNSLKAGHSFIQSIDMVSKEMAAPISQEFLKLQKEINLGYTTEQALDNLTKRVDSDDLELVIIAVLTQRQIGGNLAEILDNISDTIRERLKIKGEIRTLTAQGRVSGAIISSVPIGLAIILQIINPEYMSLLFSNKLGWAILGIAGLMQIVGIYSINKIIKIDV